jgi:hypothetical protein
MILGVYLRAFFSAFRRLLPSALIASMSSGFPLPLSSFRQQCIIVPGNHALLPKGYDDSAGYVQDGVSVFGVLLQRINRFDHGQGEQFDSARFCPALHLIRKAAANRLEFS